MKLIYLAISYFEKDGRNVREWFAARNQFKVTNERAAASRLGWCSSPVKAQLAVRSRHQKGAVTLIDFMPLAEDEEHAGAVRVLRDDRSRVEMDLELMLRVGYGRIAPWATPHRLWSKIGVPGR